MNTAADIKGHEWMAEPFWSCRCPALPGDDCPLTRGECVKRAKANVPVGTHVND